MRSSPLYLTSHPIYVTLCPLYLCKHTHSINDITATICRIPHTVYLWHPIHYIYGIISTVYDNNTLCVVETTLGICVTSFALQMISYLLYHTTPQYLWCHIHFRHGITPPLTDIAPTVSLSSQPLHWYHSQFWMTSQPPSVWHHMHYIEHHIQALCCNTTVLMTSHPLFKISHHAMTFTHTVFMSSQTGYLSLHRL